MTCALLTATNSNPASWFLYPKTKGEIEEAVAGLGFDRLDIYRPAFLKGRPSGRIMEELAGKIVPLFDRLAPNKARKVCMID